MDFRSNCPCLVHKLSVILTMVNYKHFEFLAYKTKICLFMSIFVSIIGQPQKCINILKIQDFGKIILKHPKVHLPPAKQQAG